MVLVLELEDHPNLALGHNHRTLTLPGSRKVGQSNLTMPSATLSSKSVLPSVKIGFEIRAVTLFCYNYKTYDEHNKANLCVHSAQYMYYFLYHVI